MKGKMQDSHSFSKVERVSIEQSKKFHQPKILQGNFRCLFFIKEKLTEGTFIVSYMIFIDSHVHQIVSLLTEGKNFVNQEQKAKYEKVGLPKENIFY